MMMSSTNANPDQGSGSVPGGGWPREADAKATMPLSQSMRGGTMMEHGRCTQEGAVELTYLEQPS